MAEDHIVAAVFATMNRRETAMQCIRSLASQTRPPNWVIVADNKSSDDTAGFLETMQDVPFNLIVIRMGENTGNCGGIARAIDKALGIGCSHVWILDDDSWPREDCLDKLLIHSPGRDKVTHPIQIDPHSKQLSWPMWIPDDGGWKLTQDVHLMPSAEYFPSRLAWVGTLIPTHIIREVGNVLEDLFIRGEDEEYPWRIRKAGYEFVAVRHAILDHPGPKRMIHMQGFARNFYYEPDIPAWKLYYKARNMVWLKLKQGKRSIAVSTALAYLWSTLRYDRPSRLRVVAKACIDACRGKLGRWKDHPK